MAPVPVETEVKKKWDLDLVDEGGEAGAAGLPASALLRTTVSDSSGTGIRGDPNTSQKVRKACGSCRNEKTTCLKQPRKRVVNAS